MKVDQAHKHLYLHASPILLLHTGLNIYRKGWLSGTSLVKAASCASLQCSQEGPDLCTSTICTAASMAGQGVLQTSAIPSFPLQIWRFAMLSCLPLSPKLTNFMLALQSSDSIPMLRPVTALPSGGPMATLLSYAQRRSAHCDLSPSPNYAKH